MSEFVGQEPTAIRVAGESWWHRYTFMDNSWTHCGKTICAEPIATSIRYTYAEDRCRVCWPDALTPTTEETNYG